MWGAGTQGYATKELTNVVAISVGGNHFLALRDNGTVYGWGWNRSGQAIGIPTTRPEFTNGPVRINGQLLSNISAIAAGVGFSLALRADGTVVSWGEGGNVRMNLPTDLTNITAIAAGWTHACALRRDGTVVCWGDNPLPEPPQHLTNVVSVCIGESAKTQIVSLKSDGTVVRWGFDSSTPIGLTNVVSISSGDGDRGGGHCLALKKNGTVVAWGNNSFGQAIVPPGLTNVLAIACGASHSVALKKDGTVIAWGDNRWHQTDVPGGLSNIVAISARGNCNIAIRAKLGGSP